MSVALLQLAQLERDAGSLPEAIAALQRALAIQPGDAETASLLAAYLTRRATSRAKPWPCFVRMPSQAMPTFRC